MSQPPTAGDSLRPALIGPPVGGQVALWVGDTRVVWQPDDPSTLEPLIGVGRLARSLREADRYREVVLVGGSLEQIIVMERALTRHDEPVSAAGAVIAGQPAELAPPVDGSWRTLARWLTPVVVHAAQRGEFVVLEQPGWSFADVPYALALIADEHGGPRIHLEAAPAPTSGLWPPSDQPDGNSISAPVNDENVAVIGDLLAAAVSTWATTPLDLGVTFGSVRPAEPAR